jgi:hypothetical protein
MSYMLLIIEKPGERASRSRQEGEQRYARMGEFAQELKSEHLLVGTQALRTAAARVHARTGRPVVVDGPFTEAKEMIGGYFLLSCETRDQALAVAERCPALAWATIEVREIGACFE